MLLLLAVDTDTVVVVVDSKVDTWDMDYMAKVGRDYTKAFAGQQ